MEKDDENSGIWCKQRHTLNQSLAAFTASLVKGADVNFLDLNDYEMPIFSQDIEEKIGQPQAAKNFLAVIKAADAVIVSFAEHNGSYTAAYKNLERFMLCLNHKHSINAELSVISIQKSGSIKTGQTLVDWTSRINQKVYQDKPTHFLATSPGAGGACSVLESAKASSPFFGVDLIDTVSIPSFYDAFDTKAQQVTNTTALSQLEAAVIRLVQKLGVSVN